MKKHLNAAVIAVLCLGLIFSLQAIGSQAQAAPCNEKITVLTPLGTPPNIKLKTMRRDSRPLMARPFMSLMTAL